MRKFPFYLFICALSLLAPNFVVAQDGDDEDFSMYDNLDFVDNPEDLGYIIDRIDAQINGLF